MNSGFILQSTYRLIDARAVVLHLGRLQSGETFLVRDHRQTPHFFIPAAAADERLGARVLASDMRSMHGEPLCRVEADDPQAIRLLVDRFRRRGIACFEADLRFAERELMARGIRGAVNIEGPARAPHEDERVDRVFENPTHTANDDDIAWARALRVLSIDIETDPKAERLLSIALVGRATDREENSVLLLNPPGAHCPVGATACESENALLDAFVGRVRAFDPDIITGWNVIDFDLSVLSRIAKRNGFPLSLGRLPGDISIRPARGLWVSARASITGRSVLDGISVMRGAFLSYEDFSLDAIAHQVLGTGKTLHVKDGGAEISRLFNEDREAFVTYNRTDAQLVLGILEKLELLPLTVARARLCGMALDRVNASIASFDFLYVGALGRRGIAAPSVSEQGGEPSPGGLVLEPLTGVHEQVCVFDFRSLYPSVMRTFGIDPLAFAGRERDANKYVIAPNGAAFARGEHILPGLLDGFFARRERAQAAHDKVASHALKILMNSFYGVLGTPACRFYSADISSAITSFGQTILRFAKAHIEEKGFVVLYGDTDSLFVKSGANDTLAAQAVGEKLVTEINDVIAAWVKESWQVESRLALRFEKLYARLFLPALRNASGGARKRYAGLVAGGDIEFTGLEAVRSDWTPLARAFQRELYARWFSDRPVAEYVRTLVKEVRAGQHDAALVYRKALRKPLEAYAAEAPHVVAARKMERLERRIAYVITKNGAEPLGQIVSALDYEHYVDKQIRPIAEPVLAALNLDFEELADNRRQLRLF